MSNPGVVVDVENDTDNDDDLDNDTDGDDHDEDLDEEKDSFDGSIESAAPLFADKRWRQSGLLEPRALARGSFERIVAALPKPKAPTKSISSLRRRSLPILLNDSAAWQNRRSSQLLLNCK